MKIRKAVIPVAGYGTRFLPFTKAIPKEMLPLVDRPIIQYIVEEAVGAGIEEIILITGYSKRAIEDYFDYNLELEFLLEKSSKLTQKRLIREISDIARFVYIRQKEQCGTGHAILQAKEVVGDEPFIVMSGDDLYHGSPTKLQQLVSAYDQYQAPIAFTQKLTAEDDYNRYGYFKVGKQFPDGVFQVEGLIEKPGPENVPSPYASLTAFVLTPDIFPIIEQQQPGVGGEIVLADSVNTLAQQRPVYAKECTGLKYFDCGNKLEYMKATVEFALQREDIGPDFRAYLKNLSLK